MHPSYAIAELPFREKYDPEDDVYYVTFQTNEPSHVIEHDDILLVEVGIFTNRPTGFRILNFKKHKEATQKFKARLKKTLMVVFKQAGDRARREETARLDLGRNRISDFVEQLV